MHEKNLRKNKSSNINFQFQEPGLFISQTYPNLGASPDGVISCNCCGERILEIKCPWTSRERLISEYITKNIKIEKTCKELLEGIVTLVEKSEITKKLQDDLTLVVWKKVLVKVSS